MKTMKMNGIIYWAFVILLSLNACKKDKKERKNYWLIPENEVLDGGPGKDGIPELTDPNFINASEADYLQDGDLIVGLVLGNKILAYPHAILDWHEIINDKVNGVSLAITYCPLTGTGIGWNRNVNGNITTFGVSGLLYNTNLIPYDRASNSNWSQMKLQSVNGDLIETKIDVIQVIETTWKSWKTIYPNTKVVSKETGYNRNYGSYPYGDYKTNHDKLIFPINPDDGRLPRKERVHGIIINEKAKVYQFKNFKDSIRVIHDSFQGKKIVIVGSQIDNLIISFEQKLKDGTLLTFNPVQGQLPVIIKDNEGTTWNIWGKGISGPREGEQLKSSISFIGYWLAWGAFYPDPEIY